MNKNKILKETYPYRFVESPNQERGWIEKFNDFTRRWTTMYECDSPLQLLTAMDDINYTRWLDPSGVPCYRQGRGDVVKSPYKN